MKKLVLLQLLLCATFGIKAQQVLEDKLVLKESPEGIIVYLSNKAIGGKSTPEISGVLIKRSLPGESGFTEIAKVQMAATQEDFKRTAGNDILEKVRQLKELKTTKDAWDYLQAHPSAEEYGFLSFDIGFMSAMGMLYADKQNLSGVKGKEIRYRAEFLKNDNTPGLIITGKITPGTSPAIGKPTFLSRKEGDKHVSITWQSSRSSSPDALFADVYKSDDFSKGYQKVGKIFTTTDSVTNQIRYNWTEEVNPSRFYRYFIIPVTVTGLAGPASDTVQVVSLNTSSIRVISKMTATDSSRGVLLKWQPLPANNLVTGVVIERSRQAAEGYLALDTVSASDSSWWDVKVIPGYSYYYRLKAVSIRNDTFPPSAFASVTVTPKKMFLQPPSGLKAVSSKDNVVLRWKSSPQLQIAGYAVYRSPAGSDSMMVLNPMVRDTSYMDTLFVLPGIQYKYAVKAVDFSMGSSEFSEPVYSGSSEKIPVNFPSGLIASADIGKVSLMWNDARAFNTRIVGYNIYRLNGTVQKDLSESNPAGTDLLKSNFVKINSSPVTSVIFTDNKVKQGESYSYALTATDVDGTESPASIMTTVTVPVAAWSAPVYFGLEKTDKGIIVSWESLSSTLATQCIVYRRTTAETEPEKIATVRFQDKKYTDTTAKQGVTYFYSIALGNEKQTSEKSLEKGIVR